ncbi:MAG: alpha/beta fold hydrolase [Pseudomonadota bacterium]
MTSSQHAWRSLNVASEILKSDPLQKQAEEQVPEGSEDRCAKAATLSAFLELREHAGPLDEDALRLALDREGRRRLRATLEGIKSYQSHPYRRHMSPVPVVAQMGSATLLDYSRTITPSTKDGLAVANGRPVLVVPSLVNRSYILDLLEDRSFMRFLAAQGLRPFLVNWGSPVGEERGWTLTDYINGPLRTFFDHVCSVDAQKPILLGYCMGGNLALALAQEVQSDCAAMVLLATPWNFHADGAAAGQSVASVMELWHPAVEQFGVLPTDALQSLFASVDPISIPRKFATFARLPKDSPAARNFVALEDWLADGVALAAPVAKECLVRWYGNNDPARGLWAVAGDYIVPEKLVLPSLVVVPLKDRIVPPGSALDLADKIPGAHVLKPALGHVSMMAGGRAHAKSWTPIAHWLNEME